MGTDKVPSQIFHITDDRDVQLVSGVILGLALEKEWVITIGHDDESRSLKQNRLSHMWYAHLGRESGHGREFERAQAKLHQGIPILREGKEFNEFYTNALAHLEYEQRLAAMEFVPVTSLMSVHQFAEYLNEVDSKAALRGIVLPQPKDLYFDALMKEAEERERISS
jgi:hypothetical protein